MRRKPTIRIEPHFARAEQEAGIADVMHGLFLLRADLLLDPDEFALAGEVLHQPIPIEVRKDLDQPVGGGFGIDHLLRLRIEGMGLEIGGEDASVTIHDIRPLGGDGGSRRAGQRLGRLGCGQQPHAPADHQEGAGKENTEHQEPPLGPFARAILHLFMPLAQVLALDGVWVLTLCTGRKNAGEWAKRCSDHGKDSPSTLTFSPDTSTALVIGKSGACG